MNIGLIAHESKKKLMQNFCIAYLPGHLGGVQQMKADVESNLIDLVIYLNDTLSGNQRDVKINSILQQCDIHNIPLATNLATAELLILALDRGDLDWREMYK